MDKVTLFLAKHSQKLALGFGAAATGLAYVTQPYYEMCCRWSLVQYKASGEVKPSPRILRARDERAQLDIFLVGVDQSVALGSLTSKGYAFIGIPACANYADPSEIPIDALNFYTPQFPYGPFSAIGQKRLALMIIPEDALRFLIARELLRLGVRTSNGDSLPSSARSNSLFTMLGMIWSTYVAYQTAYVLNRRLALPLRWSLPSRLLLYTTLPLFTLLCQWQIMLAWRRYNCLRVDEIVAKVDESLLRGGIAYYNWRLRWNQFWHDHVVKQYEAILHNKGRSDSYDPIKTYQDEQKRLNQGKQEAVSQTETEHLASSVTASDEGYFLPRVDGIGHQTDYSSVDMETDRPLHSGKYQYTMDPRTSSCGNERWAADGEPLGFGLTALLSLGQIAPPVARFLGLFCYPATSYTRLRRLQDQLSHM